MIKTMNKIFTLVLLFGVSFITMAQESALLRVNYEKGDQYLIAMQVTQGEAMEMTMEMDLDIIATYDEIIESTMKIKRIKMMLIQDGQIMNFDSNMADDELDEMGKMMKQQFAPMLKAQIYSKITNRAEAIEMKMEPSVPGMDQLMNGSGNVIYPKEALKVGESWDAERTENGMKMNFIYTVAAINKATVDITISGTISLLAEGTISGDMEIDRNTGNVNDTTINLDMMVSGQQMTSKINMTSTKL